MIKYMAVYKYDTPYNGPFEVTQICTNDTVTLQMEATTNIYNIRQIKPYKTKPNVANVHL